MSTAADCPNWVQLARYGTSDGYPTILTWLQSTYRVPPAGWPPAGFSPGILILRHFTLFYQGTSTPPCQGIFISCSWLLYPLAVSPMWHICAEICCNARKVIWVPPPPFVYIHSGCTIIIMMMPLVSNVIPPYAWAVKIEVTGKSSMTQSVSCTKPFPLKLGFIEINKGTLFTDTDLHACNAVASTFTL